MNIARSLEPNLACDGEAEMPLAFRVAPANENEKRYAIPLLREAAGRVKARVVVCDKQYSSRKIRKFIVDLGAEPVISIDLVFERMQQRL